MKNFVAWITSEHMIIKYFKHFQNYYNGSPVGTVEDTENDEELRQKTRQLLLQNIPNWLNQLVGQQASKMGVAKFFDVLQEKTLNKMLFYDLLELSIYNLFPELVRKYAFQQIRDISL